MPSSFRLKAGLLFDPAHMTGLKVPLGLECTLKCLLSRRKFPSGFQRRNKKKEDEPNSPALHLSLCWIFCVCDWSSSQRAVWHFSVPDTFKWVHLSVSPKSPVVREPEWRRKHLVLTGLCFCEVQLDAKLLPNEVIFIRLKLIYCCVGTDISAK